MEVEDDFEGLMKLKPNQVSLVILDDYKKVLQWIEQNAAEDFKRTEGSVSCLDFLTNYFTSACFEIKMQYGEVDWEYHFMGLKTSSDTNQIVAHTLLLKASKDNEDIYTNLYFLKVDSNGLFSILHVPFHKSGFAEQFADNVLHNQ